MRRGVWTPRYASSGIGLTGPQRIRWSSDTLPHCTWVGGVPAAAMRANRRRSTTVPRRVRIARIQLLASEYQPPTELSSQY
jgi:hypothetical protein